jgi:hypothetical protein
MKHKSFFRKALAFAVAVAMLMPASEPVPSYAAGFSDISGHWAKDYINSAIGKGVVKGYTDGTFKPDKPVTRAEFASMVNKALGNTGSASIAFNDVPSSEWYYSDISKAVAAAYVSGYSDNSFKPNSPITREEAAVMISRIVPGYGTSGNLMAFGDYSSISSWALAGMQKSNGKGYIGAYTDGWLHPKDKLTRAQTAKIICDIMDKETIVADAPSVKSNGTTLSGKIYSNGVIIHKDLGDNSAEISNCVVMGDLSIQGGGSNSIVISDSRVAGCSVAKSGSSVRVVAKGETTILNANVSNTARLETSNLTGGDSGAGFSRVNAGGSSDLTLDGSFPWINLTGSSSDVKLESGTITTLDVASSARNSDITVESYGTVTTANVNSAVAFHGTGTIRTMNANANDITYEKEPSDLNVGSGVTTKPEETDAALSITFDPANGDKNVAVNKKITITFTQAMTKYNGKDIASSDLESLINLTKDSKTGTEIPFSASINSSKKVITITPDKSLTVDVKYYVSFDRNVFMDENGDGNEAQSIYFTVGSGTVDGVTFSPANSATGVSKTVTPTITFDDAIETYAGDSITSTYLKNNIDLQLTNSSGDPVGFTASINSSKKVITITPNNNLTLGQKYYLGFGSRVFRVNSGDKTISGQSVTWTVGGETAPTISFSPASGATNIATNSGITVTFSQRVLSTSGAVPVSAIVASKVTLRDNTAGSNASYSSSVSDGASSTVFTLTPTGGLIAGHSYTATVTGDYFKNLSGVYAASASSTFTAAGSVDVSAIDTAVSRANNAKVGVSVSETGAEVYTTAYWVTSAQMTALANAITAATSAKSTVSSAAAAGTAASTLDTATATFELAKKAGLKIKPDTTAIDNAINSAASAKSGIVTSVDGTDVDSSKQWVTAGAISTLNAAITTATQAKDTVQTADAVNAAASALDTAVSTFNLQKANGTKVPVNKSSLTSAVNSARNMLNNTFVSADGTDITTDKYWVTSSSVCSSFESSITAAESVLGNTSATQADVDNAASVLNDAAAAFSDPLTRKPGTKVGP